MNSPMFQVCQMDLIIVLNMLESILIQKDLFQRDGVIIAKQNYKHISLSKHVPYTGNETITVLPLPTAELM